MNIVPENSIIVSDIAGNTLKLRVLGDDSIKKMKLIGFLHSDGFMVKTVSNENEKLYLIKELVNADALFSFGYGWYPSAVMDFYKEKGIYKGKYKFISWSDPNHYQIKEK
ncbi:hypothetical protein FJU30_23745 [Affinibrenneria salicis]|uniref:Uncharacterized protein n=1 Tax=Affinibrenneria salicis TaxID=2590031 RepID=A0A5J5FRX8_9GAMM|nr:hypothetical protein [Affinibrenneria salicis]KAA8995765.1 hypothetical protein FJU30_23745 [Affinibrenneria salicis]